MSQKDKFEFTFLSEKPLGTDSKTALAFGHGDIVKTLSEIVKHSPEAFTVGLYGDWGSGKSTIACSLKEALKKDAIPLIIFDVWKHEGDALRRTFLDSLVNQLKDDYENDVFRKDYQLDERTNASKTIIDEIQTVTWKKLKPHLFILFIISSILFLPFFLFYIVLDRITGILDIANPLGSLLIGAMTVATTPFINKYLGYFVDTKKITTNIEKFKDPQEFEDEFKRILNDGLLKKKLVIVFDNLDRVSGEKALEIMSTIKTFLDPIDKKIKDKDVIFIIPCDEKAIKRHIKKVLNFNDSDTEYERYASEYLRKFFNTIIWIPEFYTNELEKLALDNLKATKIADLVNVEVAALIVLVFDKNPRQIIQYVNILVSNYLLIRERKIEGFNLKENIAQYAKYLLLAQRFPEIMEALSAKLVYDLEDPDALVGFEIDKYTNIEEFKSFLEITNHIPIKSLDVFFKLRKSEFDSQFENSDKLMRLIESQQVKNLVLWNEHDPTKPNLIKLDGVLDKKYIEDLDISDRLPAFNSMVKQKITKTSNPVLIARFIDGLFYFTHYYKIQLDDQTYNSIITQLGKSKSYFFIINPEKVIHEGYDKISNAKLKDKLLVLVRKQWIADFVKNFSEDPAVELYPKDYSEIILKLILNKIDLFKSVNLDSVKNVLSFKFQHRFEIFETISKDKELRSALATPQYLTNVVQSLHAQLLESDHAETLQNDVTMVAKAASTYHDRFFNPDTITVVLNFLHFNISQINILTQGTTDVTVNAESLFSLFKKSVSLAKDQNKQLLTTLNTSVLSAFQQENFKLAKYLFPFVLYYHSNEHKTGTNSAASNAILQFLRSNVIASTQVEIIQSATTIPDFFSVAVFFETVNSRINQDEEFLRAFYDHLTDSQKDSTLCVWVSNIKILSNFLESLAFNIPNATALANEILTRTNGNNDLNRTALSYTILHKLNLPEDFNFEAYSNQVIDLLIATDVQKQKIGVQELNLNSTRITRDNLQTKVKVVLQNSFLPNLSTYHEQVKNILEADFHDKKKIINELYDENENVRKGILQYIGSAGNFAIFNLLYLQLNHIRFCKTLLDHFSVQIIHNKALFANYKPILEFMIKKHQPYLKDEIGVFVERYKSNLTTPVDEFISRIEGN